MARRRRNASRIARTESAVKQEENDVSLDLGQSEDEDQKKGLRLIKKEEETAQELEKKTRRR
ncbi:hypothetical protein PQX77_005846 [Marasmius sp. AFHP31]|nr:hypothetical protein PQX77_005846 [Marasmius sp. AFHP31]